MRRWIAGVVLLVVVLIAWRVLGASRRVAAPSQGVPLAVPVEVSPVAVQTLTITVTAGGNVEAIQEVTVSSKIGGRVIAVPVKEGDTVAVGQILTRLESGELTAQVQQAEATLQAAQARLQMVEQGARPQERAQVEATVAQAKANYASAQENLARMKTLYEAGAIGKAQLDAAQLQAEVARQQYEAARQQWGMMETGPRVEERQMARAQVAQAQAGVAYARLQAANATITSPLAGTVTRRFVDPGVTLAFPAQLAVARVAQIDSVYVVLDVSETDLDRVRIGQPVALRMDAYPDKVFTGTVREIGQAAEGRTRVFHVKAIVANPGHPLKPGMFGRGEITIARRENALVIPRDAVFDQGGETAVFIVEGGTTARVRKVRLGVMSGPVAEVISGLTKGDSVIVTGQSGVTDGTAITVR